MRASSTYPWLKIKEDTWKLAQLGPQEKTPVQKAFRVQVETDGYTDSGFVGGLTLEIKADDGVASTQHLMVFPIPLSPFLTDEADLAVLDGRSLTVPIYNNGDYTITEKTIQGGKGNGNGIMEPGEQVLLYVRLPAGLGSKDINTFHPAYVLNPEDCRSISVEAVRPSLIFLNF